MLEKSVPKGFVFLCGPLVVTTSEGHLVFDVFLECPVETAIFKVILDCQLFSRARKP